MIVLTGGAGFIGSCLLGKLNSVGINDILVVDNMGVSDKWKNLRGKKFIDYIHKSHFIPLLENMTWTGIDAIIHLGANSSTTEKYVDGIIDNNYRYSQQIARWALENNVYFLYASSAATYGDGSNGFCDDEKELEKLLPLNPYGYSKHLFDLWLKSEGLLPSVVGLKFFNVFGPNEYHKGSMRSLVCKAYEEILTTKTLKLFKSYKSEYKNGEQKRDFIYVKDCVEILYWFISNRVVGGIFNVGSGIARTWNDLAYAIFTSLNFQPSIEYIEMPEAIRNSYQYYTQADMSKLFRAGYKKSFTNLEDAVKDYVQCYLHPELRYY